MKAFLVAILLIVSTPFCSHACSMFKITKDGKTIVGNNEDWISPNSKFWFERGKKGDHDVMYMGQLNDFAQGAMNSAGLVFDGFAMDYLAVNNAEGKLSISISDAVREIMQTMNDVAEIKEYLATIDLSFLTTGMIVFVDKNGDYLIVEGEELILGSEPEQCFSNFYYSQIESTDEVELANFRNGMKYLSKSEGKATIDYTGEVMKNMMSPEGSTQYTTVYDLQELTVRVYLFHDYTNFVEFTLDEKIQEGDHQVMIAELFPQDSPGYINYEHYNNSDHPTFYLEELIGEESINEEEFEQMGFSWMVNTIGYEWLDNKDDAKGAIEIFKFGTELMPHNADLFDSLGEAYFTNGEYGKSRLAYEQSLILNPENEGAKMKLQEISDLNKKGGK